MSTTFHLVLQLEWNVPYIAMLAKSNKMLKLISANNCKMPDRLRLPSTATLVCRAWQVGGYCAGDNKSYDTLK